MAIINKVTEYCIDSVCETAEICVSSYYRKVPGCFIRYAILFCNTLTPEQIDDIMQMAFSESIILTDTFVFWFKFDRNLFLRGQMGIIPYWARRWLGTEQTTGHFRKQWGTRQVTHMWHKVFYIRAPRATGAQHPSPAGSECSCNRPWQAFPRDHYCSFQNVTLTF